MRTHHTSSLYLFFSLILSLGCDSTPENSSTPQPEAPTERTEAVPASLSPEMHQKIQGTMSNAEQLCTDFDGELTTQDNVVRQLDLNSDNVIDVVVIDESLLSCSTGASLYCGGSGGCSVHFLSASDLVTVRVQSWEQTRSETGEHVFRLGLHGTACDEMGATACYKDLTFKDGQFIRPQ